MDQAAQFVCLFKVNWQILSLKCSGLSFIHNNGTIDLPQGAHVPWIFFYLQFELKHQQIPVQIPIRWMTWTTESV